MSSTASPTPEEVTLYLTGMSLDDLEEHHRLVVETLEVKRRLLSDLLSACEQGDLPRVQLALDEGAPPNGIAPLARASHVSPGLTALMLACRRGHVGCVSLLIGRGANVNHARENDGTTALMLACKHGREECALSLLVAGADPNAEGPAGKATIDYAFTSPEVHSRLPLIQLLCVFGASTKPLADSYSGLVDTIDATTVVGSYAAVYAYLAATRGCTQDGHINFQLEHPGNDAAAEQRWIGAYLDVHVKPWAVEVLRVGYRLSGRHGAGTALLDVWRLVILPMAVGERRAALLGLPASLSCEEEDGAVPRRAV